MARLCFVDVMIAKHQSLKFYTVLASYSFAFATLNKLIERKISVAYKTTLRQSKFHMSSITTSLGRKLGLVNTY